MVSKLKSREAFLLAVLLNIVIWAALLDLMGLPAGLGAFLAGMLMSETMYRHQISAQIEPYATLFLALFFIVLGMGFDLHMLGANWYIIIGGLMGLIVFKFIAIFIVARVRNTDIPDSTIIALLLANGGEFALLMLQTLKTAGINAIPSAHQEILTAIIVLSIMMTPILLAGYDYLCRAGKLIGVRSARALNDFNSSVQPQVIICGFGRVGQIVAQMLTEQKIPYLAIDLNVSTIMIAREHGLNVVYGDTTNDSVLRDFGVGTRRIRAVVVALDNAGTARKTVAAVKSIVPRMKIFARARNLADSQVLLKDGVFSATPETIESSFFLGRRVLNHLGTSDIKIKKMLSQMRVDNYAELSSQISDKH